MLNAAAIAGQSDRLVLHDGEIWARAPFCPGTVIDSARPFAERVEAEGEDRGGNAGATTGNPRLVDIDAGFFKSLRDALLRYQATVLDDFVVRHVKGARHMSEAQT